MAEISNRPVTPAQIRTIHIALAHRGISREEHRARLNDAFGVDTSTKLTRRQAHEYLRSLGIALKAPPGAKTPRKPRARKPRTHSAPGVVRLPSAPQRQLIDALAAEIAWREADGFRRWLRHNMGMERVATTDAAARVIEGLKAIKRRGGE